MPHESQRPRLKSLDSLKLHSQPDDSTSTSCSIQSSIISPSTNVGETTLPALAEMDEDGNSDVKEEPGKSPTGGGEQTQTDDQGEKFSPLKNGQSTSKLKNPFTTRK